MGVVKSNGSWSGKSADCSSRDWTRCLNAIKVPHHLSTSDNEDQNYDQMLMQHPLFNRNETWYLGCKPTGTLSGCSAYICVHL